MGRDSIPVPLLRKGRDIAAGGMCRAVRQASDASSPLARLRVWLPVRPLRSSQTEATHIWAPLRRLHRRPQFRSPARPATFDDRPDPDRGRQGVHAPGRTGADRAAAESGRRRRLMPQERYHQNLSRVASRRFRFALTVFLCQIGQAHCDFRGFSGRLSYRLITACPNSERGL